MYTTLPHASPESTNFTYGLERNEPIIASASVGLLRGFAITGSRHEIQLSNMGLLADNRRNLLYLEEVLQASKPEAITPEIRAVTLKGGLNVLFRNVVECVSLITPGETAYRSAVTRDRRSMVDLTIDSARGLFSELMLSEYQAVVRAAKQLEDGANGHIPLRISDGA